MSETGGSDKYEKEKKKMIIKKTTADNVHGFVFLCKPTVGVIGSDRDRVQRNRVAAPFRPPPDEFVPNRLKNVYEIKKKRDDIVIITVIGSKRICILYAIYAPAVAYATKTMEKPRVITIIMFIVLNTKNERKKGKKNILRKFAGSPGDRKKRRVMRPRDLIKK